MLITNFASGELSENLFGRTDLPQYFQGVSRLENFDVIPTGGIQRRNGLRRLAEMGGPGRIIPFIIDRENSYLLFLSPESGGAPARISVYSQEGELKSFVDGSEELPLYRTMEEINHVQHAQRHDVIVMAHKRYPPLCVRKDGDLSVAKLSVNTGVEIIASKSSVDKEAFHEEDKTYLEGRYLTSAGNYPSVVTFFQGRLVFAGGELSPQRIFASRVNDIENFTTYKKYVTETREYITVEASVDLSNNVITLVNPFDEGKFVKPITEYVIESSVFPKGTMVAAKFGDKLFADRNPITVDFPEEMEEALFSWRSEKEALDRWSGEYHVYYREYYDKNPPYPCKYDPKYYDNFADNVYLSYRLGEWKARKVVKQFISNGGEGAANVVFEEQTSHVISQPKLTVRDKDSFNAYLNGKKTDVNRWGDYNQFAADFFNFLQDTMIYDFEAYGRTVRYYGTPGQIYHEALKASGKLSYADNVFISFYTTDYIEDRAVSPDDGFTFEIASDMSDAIKWIGQNKNLIVGTETGEWIIPAGVNAGNVQAVLNSRYGSDDVQGTAVGDAFCFIQTGKKAVVEYYIPQQDNNFRANNMAMLSKNMLGESAAFDFDFASAPYTRIFISREDGTAVSLLYERMTGAFAWGRITTRAGAMRSVAVLPGQGEDEAYFIVERGARHFLERLDGRDEVYLDSFRRCSPDAPLGPGEAREGEYAGFPYASRVRSMPVLANDQMKVQAIKKLKIRFLDSYLPRVKSFVGAGREVQEDSIAREEPYSGILQISFPGQFERDVFFELVHDKPTRCRILAVNAEAG